MSTFFNERGFTEEGAKLLGAAQHQDRINSWSPLARFGHRFLVSYRCPACIYWDGDQSYTGRVAALSKALRNFMREVFRELAANFTKLADRLEDRKEN